MKSNTHIKEGYKKTAVGVIPEEWEVKRFDKCFKHLKAYTVSRNQLNYDNNESCIFNIHYGDIHSTFPRNRLDVKSNINLIPAIINSDIDNPELLQDGDVIMADASEDYKGIGQSIELANVGNRKIVSGTHTFPLRPKEEFAPKYAGFIFSEFNTHKQIKRIATGISVFGISKGNIAKIKLPIPPLPEQQAIANCLTTWDKGIETLSTLIAAKQEQKKGLMQQLLTGKKRLKGFVGEWEEVKLDKLGKFTSGNGFPVSEQGGTSGIPFYKVSDMNLKGNESKMSISNNYLSSSQIERLKLRPINKISIIFAKVGAAIFLERKRVAESFLIDNNMMAFTPYIFNDFIKYVFDTIKLSRYVQVGALPSYNASDLKNIKIRIPSLEEQTAIAHILTTADKEITLLEKKLEAMKEEKKGLMQVLLTGEKQLKVEN